MARYEPCATTGRVPSLFLKAEHSSQGVGYASLGILIEDDRPCLFKEEPPVYLTFLLVVVRSTDDSLARSSSALALCALRVRASLLCMSSMSCQRAFCLRPISPSEDEQSIRTVRAHETRNNTMLPFSILYHITA
jgi:hypothetical protein